MPRVVKIYVSFTKGATMKISGEKIKQTVSSVKEHWSKPPEGRYIPYKEILAYSIGGIGVKFVIYTVWYISLSATSLLAG